MAKRKTPKAPVNKNISRVLKRLLSQIELIDFHESAGVSESTKVPLSKCAIIVIKELLDTAVSNEWGLCTHNDVIYIFNGEYWLPVDKRNFKRFLSDVAIAMGISELDAKYHKFKTELYDQFVSEAVLPEPEPRRNILINLRNGTFEITPTRQRLREHRQGDFLTYQLPFDYDPDAKCPLFRKYLWDVLPDLDCRKILAEFMGFIFTTNLKLEKALFLYGTGSNGKSVFFDVINAVIGRENISSYSLQTLTRENSYERADISTKLLNYSTEINEKMDPDMFKKLASREPVQARHIYGHPFTMSDYSCKLIFNCNVLPAEIERTNAFFRRLIIIPFNRVFGEWEQNINLAQEIIDTELSGVFNWILGGLNRLLAQGKFTESEVVWQQMEDYRKESDSVALFLDDKGIGLGVDKTVPLAEMYLDYSDFCREYGFRPLSVINMAKRLRATGLITVKANYGMKVLFGKSKERIEAEEESKRKREQNRERMLRKEEYQNPQDNEESDEGDESDD